MVKTCPGGDLKATAAPGGAMTMKEKLLLLLLVVAVIVLLMLTHVAGHLAFVMENCFAAVFPALRM